MPLRIAHPESNRQDQLPCQAISYSAGEKKTEKKREVIVPSMVVAHYTAVGSKKGSNRSRDRQGGNMTVESNERSFVQQRRRAYTIRPKRSR